MVGYLHHQVVTVGGGRLGPELLVQLHVQLQEQSVPLQRERPALTVLSLTEIPQPTLELLPLVSVGPHLTQAADILQLSKVCSVWQGARPRGRGTVAGGRRSSWWLVTERRCYIWHWGLQENVLSRLSSKVLLDILGRAQQTSDSRTACWHYPLTWRLLLTTKSSCWDISPFLLALGLLCTQPMVRVRLLPSDWGSTAATCRLPPRQCAESSKHLQQLTMSVLH